MRIRALPAALALAALCAVDVAPASAQEPVDLAMLARIREEGLERSRALETYLTLSDRMGPRLPGSPVFREAAAWARDRFAEWGLTNARLEAFEFGRGWSLERLTLEMTAPRYAPLIGYAEAWTPSTAGALGGPVIYVGDLEAEQIRALGERLRGAIVLTHQPQAAFIDGDRPQPGLSDEPVRTGNPPGVPVRTTASNQQLRAVLQEMGAGVTIRPSAYRDGTVGVLGSRTTGDDAVPSVVMAAEQYNMLARLAQAGAPPELHVEVATRYYEEDPNTHNVLADIPGTDPELADEVVLVGAHLDAWHTANGATDNGDGVLAVMEAMRILAAVGAQPRRTIRAALWSGEEQGLLGARAYIEQHLANDPAAQERLSVYLNDDPGSGKTLGFYMQENAGAKAIFDAWLAPLQGEGGMTLNVVQGIGSTDHVPFDEMGIPAFTAIKDFAAYDERTRHTNADYPERMSEDELKQQAIALAHFAWNAAQRDERIPRVAAPPRR